ncbi:hypothetical protein EJ07DRAFT_126380 [Lizonia empirigonia]|nr:hypothetical protein EJ07DRAFT_126380 [Lizonia empirigonia]
MISTQYIAGAASYQTPSNTNHSNARRGLPRGEGPSINGSYNPAVQGSHYEDLDPSYTVRPSNFFHEGRVFAVMWNETAGATLRPVDYNTSRSYNEVRVQGNIVYTNVRRFVVVRKRREFCFACPIFTYGNQGTKKNGVRPSEHAIAHVWGTTPQLLQDETGIMKNPIPIVMVEGNSLNIASRIYFGIHHPVQYNVKVKDIGYVPPDQVHTLIGNWREETGG